MMMPSSAIGMANSLTKPQQQVDSASQIHQTTRQLDSFNHLEDLPNLRSFGQMLVACGSNNFAYDFVQQLRFVAEPMTEVKWHLRALCQCTPGVKTEGLTRTCRASVPYPSLPCRSHVTAHEHYLCFALASFRSYDFDGSAIQTTVNTGLSRNSWFLL